MFLGCSQLNKNPKIGQCNSQTCFLCGALHWDMNFYQRAVCFLQSTLFDLCLLMWASIAVKQQCLGSPSQMVPARPHLLFSQPNYDFPPAQKWPCTRRIARLTNEITAYCRLDRKRTNQNSTASDRHAFYAFSGKKLVPALPWPFPVIVQCCETEKAMCVDAKVNLAHRNYFCER